MTFFETFPECSPPSTVLKKETIKMIGCHACLTEVMCQPYPIYASTSANHMLYLLVQLLHFEIAGSIVLK